MNTPGLEFDAPADHALHQVIEPLASYICAADQPRATLVSVLKRLLSEVEQTNSAALGHLHAWSGRC